ncbi:hypothetical protein LTR17_027248, partial [Elasticomyces elasticus]
MTNEERRPVDPGFLDAYQRLGSAEYLACAILDGCPDGCPHPDKMKTGPGTLIPSRLGFFHHLDNDISYLDTNKLCQECYALAAPDGFYSTSSMYFRPEDANPPIDKDAKFPDWEPPAVNGEETGVEYFPFPRQLEAGTEKFFERYSGLAHLDETPEESSSREKWEILGFSGYAGLNYVQRLPMIPGAHMLLAWKYLKRLKQPFYIDILHLYPPWQSGLSDDADLEEGKRVMKANAPAFLGAKWVILASKDGGTGPYTAAEERMAGDRLLPIGVFYKKFEAKKAAKTDQQSEPVTEEQMSEMRHLRTERRMLERRLGELQETSKRYRGLVTETIVRGEMLGIGPSDLDLSPEWCQWIADRESQKMSREEHRAGLKWGMRPTEYGPTNAGYDNEWTAVKQLLDEVAHFVDPEPEVAAVKHEIDRLSDEENRVAPGANRLFDPRYYGDLGPNSFEPLHQTYPPETLVNSIVFDSAGVHIPPTRTEIIQRNFENDLPEELSYRLPYNYRDSAPPVEPPFDHSRFPKSAVDAKGNETHQPRSPEVDREREFKIPTDFPTSAPPRRYDLTVDLTQGGPGPQPPLTVKEKARFAITSDGTIRRQTPVEVRELHTWLYPNCVQPLAHDRDWTWAFRAMRKHSNIDNNSPSIVYVKKEVLASESSEGKQPKVPGLAEKAVYLGLEGDNSGNMPPGVYRYEPYGDFSLVPENDLEANPDVLHNLFHNDVPPPATYAKPPVPPSSVASHFTSKSTGNLDWLDEKKPRWVTSLDEPNEGPSDDQVTDDRTGHQHNVGQRLAGVSYLSGFQFPPGDPRRASQLRNRERSGDREQDLAGSGQHNEHQISSAVEEPGGDPLEVDKYHVYYPKRVEDEGSS